MAIQLYSMAARQFPPTTRPSAKPLPDSCQAWLLRHFRPHFATPGGEMLPFASFHEAFFAWVDTLRAGVRPQPFVGIWPRGAGKSTDVELATVYLGYHGVRRYGLYCSMTQEQADDHVQNVATALEHPWLGVERMVGKYGHSRGWRRNRLRTMDGFTLDAIGLDTAARGAKLDEDRPDLLLLDDLDNENDSELLTARKLRALTRKLLPAGTPDLAVMAMQNLVHEHGIFARLVDGRADFLSDRLVSGPFPALTNLTYEGEGQEARITGGEPTWAGLSLAQCQAIVRNEGLDAFLAERQHEKRSLQGTLLGDVWHDSVHVLEPFAIPRSWRLDRSFDWGETKPFSVGWWAESDGSKLPDGRWWPKGTLFRVAEWYGWNGKPNQGLRLSERTVAQGIRQREQNWDWWGRVQPGPAGADLFTAQRGVRLADGMAAEGIRFEEADTRSGSRKAGARRVRTLLEVSARGARDEPGLYVFRGCQQWLRTVPAIPRDLRDPDDADTEAEDHAYDETRYRAMRPRSEAHVGKLKW